MEKTMLENTPEDFRRLEITECWCGAALTDDDYHLHRNYALEACDMGQRFNCAHCANADAEADRRSLAVSERDWLAGL